MLTFRQKPYQHWEFLDVSSGSRLRLLPERGGLVSEWFCQGREILYFDEIRFRDSEKSIRGGIPILFPICGNLPGDLLHLENDSYFLRQHGFARDFKWQIGLNPDK